MDDPRLTRIETKLDDLSDHLSSIDSTLSAQHESLKEHIRRTALLEEDIKPIKVHVNRVEGALKLITLMAAIAAVIELVHRF